MKTLLVIDPNPVDALLIADILREDFHVEVAHSSKKAIELSNSIVFDLVILDQTLKDSTGLETMKQLREERPPLNFIIVTSIESVQLAIQSLKSGAMDFLIKPIEPYRLKHIVKVSLRAIEIHTKNIKLMSERTLAAEELKKYKEKYGEL